MTKHYVYGNGLKRPWIKNKVFFVDSTKGKGDKPKKKADIDVNDHALYYISWLAGKNQHKKLYFFVFRFKWTLLWSEIVAKWIEVG